MISLFVDEGTLAQANLDPVVTANHNIYSLLLKAFVCVSLAAFS